MTVAEAVGRAAATLAATTSPDGARRDASVLLRHLLGWTMADWLTCQHHDLSEEAVDALDGLVARRVRHEPVAYLIGEKEFYGRAFRVTRDVLIPRPETELLVERALAIVDTRASAEAEAPARQFHLLDVGTGSGCIAVTLACERPRVRVTATDVSAAALSVASANALRHGAGDRVTFVQASLTASAESVDVVVSNPPYVPLADRAGLMPDVREHEPPGALFGGENGLAVIEALVPDAARALRPGGVLLIEIGTGQAPAVCELCERHGLVPTSVHRDLAGIDRVVEAHVPHADEADPDPKNSAGASAPGIAVRPVPARAVRIIA